MPVTINIGSNLNNPADDLVTLTVRPGDTVTIKNLQASTHTVNVHGAGHGGGASSTVAGNAATNISTPGTHYLSSQGRSSVTLSGGLYG